jgi:hypothetical protein
VKAVTSEGWLLLGEGPRHGSPIRHFTFSLGRRYAPTLMIEDFGNGKFEYSDTMLKMGKKIPQPDIDYTLRSCGTRRGMSRSSAEYGSTRA